MKKKQYDFRRLINDIHLYLGLVSGVILFLICLSGSFLAFEHEIKAFFAEKHVIKSDGQKQHIEGLISNLENSYKGRVTGFTIPANENEPYKFTIKNSREKRASSLLVDPYTGMLLPWKKTAADAFLQTMLKLHRWLLFDKKVGRPIAGISTLIFIILSISGIILWFPKKLKWKYIKQGFKIKTNAKWKRVNHDLHKTLGFYVCIFTIILGLTGLCWSFKTYRNILGNLLNAEIFNKKTPNLPFKDAKVKKEKYISLEDIIALANVKLNYKGKLVISFPQEKGKVYTFKKYNDSNRVPYYDKIYIDGSGKILSVELFKDRSFTQQIASLIKPLHTGEIYGTPSKILYFLVSIIAASLPITGFIIWFNKLKKKSTNAKA